MTNILNKIVNERRQDIEQLKQKMPLESFQQGLTPSTRSLFNALSEDNTSFILEFKKASPSKGLIRDQFDLDEIATAYGPHATAVSVLTEHRYFQGDFSYLQQVSEKLSQPVINKDFLFDSYQVYLARYYNADAILLMLSVLTDEQYLTLASVADSLDLDILTEVSNSQEVQRAIALDAKIIGINNRNLRDLSTDLATTEKLAPMIPSDRLIISESGIYTHGDVRRLSTVADGFLVGSSLMAERDVAIATANLVYGSVKICGITDAQGAAMVKRSGARYAGLILSSQSKRYIDVATATLITQQVPFNYVGVFVDQSLSFIINAAQILGLKAVQLHGNETDSFRQALSQELPEDCEVWQAVGVSDELPPLALPFADRTLLDCRVGSSSGGTGQVFDWCLLEQLVERDTIGLAGGLSPSNIAQAGQLKMAFLDVNSGVEDAPGKKSKEKINQLFNQLRCY